MGQDGFFSPRYAFEDRRSLNSRVYSFRDVVGLRTLSILRKQYKVSLQHLRKVAEELSHLGDALWSETTLYVMNREVYFREPETGVIRGVLSRQYTDLPLRSIISDVSAEASKLRERTAEQVGQVDRHRYIAHNAWVVAGTRIPTKAIQRFKEAGYSIENILREYPTITEKDVQAALKHERKISASA